MLFYFLGMAPGQGGGGAGIGSLLPMIAIFVILYLLILRPQARRQKEHQKMLGALNKGDSIVTTGGIHGIIQKANETENTLQIKVGDDTRIVIDRAAVGRKIVPETKTG